jgi:hypothetical protein
MRNSRPPTASRRAALERVGGFDERFTRAWREDADLMFALREHAGPIVEAEAARIVHPVRPARWGTSIGQQSKVFRRAAVQEASRDLPAAHPADAAVELLRGRAVRARRARLLRLGWRAAGIACALVWAAITAAFCIKRLRGTQLTPSHVAEMIVTSIAIPPVSLYWRLRGALHFRVFFL